MHYILPILSLVVAACGGADRGPAGIPPDNQSDGLCPTARYESTKQLESRYDPFAAPDDVAAVPPDATTLPSGLAFRVLRASERPGTPSPSATVTAHYTGWRAEDGEMFDSSHTRNEPFTAPLSRLIRGWQEGMPLMRRGEIRRFWIPSELAYGNRKGAPQGMLVFDIELIDYSEPEAQ